MQVITVHQVQLILQEMVFVQQDSFALLKLPYLEDVLLVNIAKLELLNLLEIAKLATIVFKLQAY